MKKAPEPQTVADFDDFCKNYQKQSKTQIVYPGKREDINIPGFGVIETVKMASGTRYVVKNGRTLERMDEKWYSKFHKNLEVIQQKRMEEKENNGENELPSDGSNLPVEAD